MGVNLGRFTILVSEQFLDCPDVIPILQKMCGERVAQGVGACGFDNTGALHGLFDYPVQGLFVNVVSSFNPGPWIGGDIPGRKSILPLNFPCGIRIFT